MSSILIQNRFNNGMISDSLESLQVPGSYRYALNAVDQSRTASNFGLTQEEKIALAASFSGTIVGITYIEERNQLLVFVNNGQSELWLYKRKDKSKTFVCADAEFGCDWKFSNCELLYAEFKKFNKCKELHAYWSSDCTYHVVNIDEMLDADRKAAINDLEDPCGHFDLAKCICGPHVSAIPSKFNGANLEAGAYACAIQLSDSDGNDTNIFDVGKFAYAESEDNIAGQISKSSIKFNISNLDKRYSKAHIYIVKTVAGVTTIEKMDTRTYTNKGFTFDYYGQKGELIDVSVLINKPKAYLRGQDLIQKDNRMFFYSLRNERNLNYQKYANQIVTECVEWEVSLEQAAKYHFVSMLRGEVYALAIVFKFCDGTYSKAFHIPAGAGASILQSVSTNISSSGSYAPYSLGDFDTTDQFKRDRNPSALKDRPNESDKLENSVKTDAQNIDTDKEDLIAAAECHDNLYECGTAETILTQDFDDLSNGPESNAELLAGFGIDNPDPDVNTTTTLKDAADMLINNAVTNREYITRKRPTLSHTGVNMPTPGTPPTDPDPIVTINAANTRGDNWVDGFGNNLTDEPPREIPGGTTIPYISSVLYPNDKDCDGERFYPEGGIRHHRMPWASEKQPYVSFTNGVENQYQPDNHPFGKTVVRLLGLKFSNIHIPSGDELPKPLCPNSPYKFVYVKRTNENKSIFAKGFLTGIFEGENYGVNYAFPRHGVNSFEHVDRMIAPVDDATSRLGQQSTRPIYNFHSPDTDSGVTMLPVNKIKSELNVKGSGWRYGLYSEGKKPVTDQWAGTRIDARGARVANNLNQPTPGSGTFDILGIQEAKANHVPTPASGITLPLMNRFRESSVYLQASGRLPGDEVDRSFVGDVLDHFAPTNCNAPYAALIRDLPDQYGSVEGLRYADLGINATQVHADGASEIKGICGDTYIGPYSKKRTSYVSNKQGDLFNVPAKPGSPCRVRAWCDSPEDKIFEYTGIDFYPTKLPKSGDKWDPKNYAGLHTINGGSCGGAVSKPFSEAQAVGSSESDFYGPRTLNSLVHTIVECEVNPYLRETGAGSQKIDGKVHYGNLKDLHLDANAPVGQPWEDSWLGRFRSEIHQPSVKQLTKKAALRTALTTLFPAGLLLNLTNLEGIIGPGMAYWIYPMLSALWITATNTLFTDRKLNEMLRIGDCKRDEEGGDLDELVTGFEDNYTVYNRDFQRVNDIYPYYAFPLPYNTCPCNDCSKDNINDEIYYTNPQNPDSDIDAYKNIKINDYRNLPCHIGKLKKLFKINNQLLAHLTDGIAPIKLNPIQMTSDIVLQQSGDGQLLTEPQLMFEGIIEGFAGTEHPNAAINTPLGYFFVDNKANKLYRFNGSYEEISAYGMFQFFAENLSFCNEKECYDEKSADGNHYSLGWDPRYNRLLITKYDGDTCSSWTASFKPAGEKSKWLSFHSHIPQNYVWTRDTLYSVSGGNLYEHNQDGEYCSVDGTNVPFVVEFVANLPESPNAFEFVQGSLNTLAEKGFKKNIDITFNKVAIYNSTQGTGTREIEIISDDSGKRKDQYSRAYEGEKIKFTKDIHKRWNFNEVHDFVKENCRHEEMVKKECECSPITEINEEVFSCEKIKSQGFQGRILVDDHIIYRFTLDNNNDTRLYLKSLITKVEPSKE